jgi:hypothetical protein
LRSWQPQVLVDNVAFIHGSTGYEQVGSRTFGEYRPEKDKTRRGKRVCSPGTMLE